MSERKPVRSWSEVVGENIAERRREIGLTQDAMAAAMHELGYRWIRSTVAAVETGKREPDLGELVGLCSVLGVPVGDLVGGRVERLRVQVGPGAVTRSSTARSALETGSSFRSERVMNQIFRAEYPGLDEALQKAARALGVDRGQVDTAARELWDRSIVDEREARLGDVRGLPARTVQARRGHVTRALVAELREHLSESRTGEAGPR